MTYEAKISALRCERVGYVSTYVCFQKGEIQVMQARMQDSHVQHMSEVNHYRSQLEAKAKQTNDSIGQIQNLKEENKILQDAISKAQ